MFLGNRENSSGGPFFRDIENQEGSQQEIYNYMNSGHTQTENFYRMGLHGPYALLFNEGRIPNCAPDMTWISHLELNGFYNESQRGTLTGPLSGISADSGYVVGMSNADAQYWTWPKGGSYVSPAMIPRVYNVTLYKNELEVAVANASVQARETSNADLVVPSTVVPSLFAIGEFDGTPQGFRNANFQLDMHPSDVRMNSWNTNAFYVDSSALSDFPMAQFKSVNNPQIIRFYLQNEDIKDHNLTIGITLAFAGARPQVNLNPNTSNAYYSNIPAPSNHPNSRGVTRGTYRGKNTAFTFRLPARSFLSGWNEIQIYAVSGSSGDSFLSPNFVYDAIRLER